MPQGGIAVKEIRQHVDHALPPPRRLAALERYVGRVTERTISAARPAPRPLSHSPRGAGRTKGRCAVTDDEQLALLIEQLVRLSKVLERLEEGYRPAVAPAVLTLVKPKEK